MKKNRIVFFLLFSSPIFAVEPKNSPLLPDVDGSGVYFAPLWEYLDSGRRGGLHQRGSLWGGAVGYSYSEKDGIYANVEFSAAGGTIHGRGGGSSTWEYNTEIRLGYTVTTTCERLNFSPFIGIGSYIFDQIPPLGPKFTSNFWYVPIGLIVDYRLDRNWGIALTGLGAPTFSGSYTSGITKNLSTAALWKVEVPVSYYGSLPFELSLVPFAKQFAYLNKSESVRRKNRYYGLKAVFAYRF